jgi:hypothetical protein
MIQRAFRCYGDCAEQAEPHGRLALGVVAGWARGTERVRRLARHHGIDRPAGRTHRAERRLERARREMCVGIESPPTLGRDGRTDPVDIALRVAAQHVCDLAHRRVLADQRIEGRVFQQVEDDFQPAHAFGVAGRGDMAEAIGVGQEERGHACEARRSPGPVQSPV